MSFINCLGRWYWVHSLLEVNYVEGAFYATFNKLVEDEIKYFNYLFLNELWYL